MLESRVEEYRRKENECRALAVQAQEHGTKEGWMKLADRWRRMAEEARPVQQAQEYQAEKRS
jgi:hypothetical protein